MRAIVLEKPHTLLLRDWPKPKPAPEEVLIEVSACAICRTDLHLLEGELPHPKLPLIPGHQVVGRIVERGSKATRFEVGTRVGVAWLGSSCGQCPYCHQKLENLCDKAIFTGYLRDGGLAEFCTANQAFIYPLPSNYSDELAAPLLCAGMIGYRSLKFAQEAKNIGFYGFGAAAHLLTPVALFQKKRVFAFTKPGDRKRQEDALKRGASWAGDSTEMPPELLDAALIFAPVGELVPFALKAIRKAGQVICAGIHMSDIPSFPYSLLWEEKVLRSVANLTRKDGEEWLKLAPQVPVKPEITLYPLEKTLDAFEALKQGKITGSAVIKISKT